MTSMPASRSARAMIFAPRSCPSRPGFATTTRMFPAIAREATDNVAVAAAKRGDTRKNPVAMLPETRYAERGDVHIGYQITGEGDTDLVLVPEFWHSIEAQWDQPELADFLTRLSSLG